MKTIWKYPLELKGLQNISIPEGAEILHCAIQNDGIFLWALVDPSLPLQRREIEMIGTGNEVSEDEERKYISTIIDGALVWHIFEII